MTGLQATALVAGRELTESFRRRSLWIVLAILFLASSAAMIVPDLIGDGGTQREVAVVDESTTGAARTFEAALRSSARAVDTEVRFERVSDPARARALVDDGAVDAAVVVSSAPLVIVRAGGDETLVALVRGALAQEALLHGLDAAGIDPAVVEDILTTPAPRVEEVAVDDSDRRAASAVLSLVLYLVLLMLMIQAANGVAIEKANRISEVLLAVVRPGALLFGKVIGVGIVGLVGLTAAAVPVVAKAAVGGDLPAGLGPAIAGGSAWMVLGLVLYLTIAGALGALVERQEEAGSVLTPLSLLLVVTYVLAQSTTDSGLGAVLAIVPLTSPIVMPARIALGEASAAEIVASLAVGILTVALVVRLGAAIYRRGIVHTGRRLRLGEALREP